MKRKSVREVLEQEEDKHVKNKTELVDEVKTDDIKIGTEKPGQADDEKSALNEDIADTEEENTFESSDNLPIDKGWAWIILLGKYINPLLSGNPKRVLRQTLLTQIRRHIMRRLIRVSTVCQQQFLSRAK